MDVVAVVAAVAAHGAEVDVSASVYAVISHAGVFLHDDACEEADLAGVAAEGV